MSCREQTLPSSRSAALLRMGDMWREGLADGRESSASAAEMYKLAALRNEPQVARLTSHCFFFFPSWDNLLFSKASETGLFSFPPQRVGTTWACWWKRASGHQRRCSPSSAFPASPLRTSTRLRLLSTKGLLKRPQKMNNYLSVGDRVCGGKKPDHLTDAAFSPERCRDSGNSDSFLPCSLALLSVVLRGFHKEHCALLKVGGTPTDCRLT